MTSAVWIDQSRLENQNIESLWPLIMGLLKRDLTPSHFERLLRGVRAVRLDGFVLTLAAADQASCDWLESRLSGSILGCVQEVISTVQELRIVAGTGPTRGEEGRDRSDAGGDEIRAREVWQKTLASLKAPGLSKEELEKILAGVRAIGLRAETGNLVISAPSKTSALQLRDRLGYEITSALRRTWERKAAPGYAFAVPEFVTGKGWGGGDSQEPERLEPDAIWQKVLFLLQLELPRASFDTYVQGTEVLGFENGVLTIGASNTFSRDWLEDRLASIASRLLARYSPLPDTAVRFVVDGAAREKAEEEAPIEEGDEVRGRFAYVSRYQEIVKPHRVIVLDGYMLRLLPQTGPRAFWARVGIQQAAWSHSKGANLRGEITFRASVSQIARFAGVSRATMFSWMSKKDFWLRSEGLFEKTVEDPKWKAGPDARLHRDANEYTVHMTLPLSHADALALKTWLEDRLEKMSLSQALQAALEIPAGSLVGEVFLPIGAQPAAVDFGGKFSAPPRTVSDIALILSGKKRLSKDEAVLSEALHTKIVTAFGTIAITHYFIEQVIPHAALTPEQAALIVACRSRCYANPKTGEIRNKVVAGGGFEEMAAWIGLSRPKTVWTWLTGRTDKKELDGSRRVTSRKTTKGDGVMPAFVRVEGELRRGGASEKRLTVRMMEPLFGGTETLSNDGTQTISFGGTQTHSNGGSQTHRLDGTRTDLWRNWDGFNDSYNLALTLGISRDTTSTTPNAAGERVLPSKWSLSSLLVQNGIYPVNIRKIIARDIPAEYVVAWLFYCFSAEGANLKPEDTLVSNLLHKAPSETPGNPYDKLAKLPPRIVFDLVKATRAYPSNGSDRGTGNADWDRIIGVSNPRIEELGRRLFGDHGV